MRRTSRRSVFGRRFSIPRSRSGHGFHCRFPCCAHYCSIRRTESIPTVSSKNINPTPPDDLNPIPDRVRRNNVSGFLQTTLSKVPRNYISAPDVVGRRGTSDKVLTFSATYFFPTDASFVLHHGRRGAPASAMSGWRVLPAQQILQKGIVRPLCELHQSLVDLREQLRTLGFVKESCGRHGKSVF